MAPKRKFRRLQKFSDSLGGQWTNEELVHFYEAYRKHGKNWKRVASVLPNRSVDMVEALYTLNRAYLSLPEGTATVAGLLAMMTDHYCVLEESHGGQEERDSAGRYGTEKQGCMKKKHSSSGLLLDEHSSALSQHQSNASTYDCLSYLKKKPFSGGTQLPVVRKRTPRYPVHILNQKISIPSASKQGMHDVGADHEAAVTLAQASERGGSQFSQTVNRITEDVWDGKRKMGKSGVEGRRSYNHRDDVEEESSTAADSLRNRSKMEGAGVEVEKAFLQGQRKKSRHEAHRGDEGSAFAALHTLADLSLMLDCETESYAQVKDDKANGKSRSMEIKPLMHQASLHQNPGSKQGGNYTIPGTEDAQLETSEEKVSDLVDNSIAESVKDPHISVTGIAKGKKKTLKIKVFKQGNKTVKKAKCFSHAKRRTGYRMDMKIQKGLTMSPETLKVSNCLSCYQARRWCTFEWFYSAIDYPWFAKGEFVDYLKHVRLAHASRLTRVEWGVIRSSLGKPRRLSENFLKEEREKLQQYRDSVRMLYAGLLAHSMEGLPRDLPLPFSAGQHVIAIHPKTREIHNGEVLTLDHTKCRVRFDCRKLGVEFVMDIDCMPVTPLENLPASLIPPSIISEDKVKRGAICVHQHTEDVQLSTVPQFQARKADDHALAELSCGLAKKEALLHELRCMNDEGLENQREGNVEIFKKQYASVLLQLDKVDEEVCHALLCLSLHNKYQRKPPPTDLEIAPSLGDSCDLSNSSKPFAGHSNESRSFVADILESSKTEARVLVDSAVQALSSVDKDKHSHEGTEEALVQLSSHISVHVSGESTIGASTPRRLVHGGLSSINEMSPNMSSHTVADHAPPFRLSRCSDQGETIPSELITNCVATLLLIQKYSERPFPFDETAQVLDFAVTSLQPSSSQNLPIYKQIKRCMGIIQNQIMALVPV